MTNVPTAKQQHEDRRTRGGPREDRGRGWLCNGNQRDDPDGQPTTRSWQDARKSSPLMPERAWPCHTLISDLWPLELEGETGVLSQATQSVVPETLIRHRTLQTAPSCTFPWDRSQLTLPGECPLLNALESSRGQPCMWPTSFTAATRSHDSQVHSGG